MKHKKMQILLLLLGGLAALGVIGVYAMSLTAPRPENLGVKNAILSPVAKSPNSVSTQTDSQKHRMEPLRFSGEPGDVMEALRQIVESQRGATVIEHTGNYLYAEFRSTIFRFVDDVEFFVDEKNKEVHFRSASRVGHSDFGVNRERMSRIGREFSKRFPELAP